MTRSEHLAWCKSRSLAILNRGDRSGAFASMTSDLSSHPETANHVGLQLGMMMLMTGHLNTQSAMKDFIEGFN